MTHQTKTASFSETLSPPQVKPATPATPAPDQKKDRATVLQEIGQDSLVSPQKYLRDSIGAFGE